MKSENRDAKLILGEALRLSVLAEREAYPERACAGNRALRQEVPELLSAHAQAGDFLDQSRPLPASDIPAEPSGTMVGRYKPAAADLRGGYGVVHMAEQVEPMQDFGRQGRTHLGLRSRLAVERNPTKPHPASLIYVFPEGNSQSMPHERIA